MPVQQPKLPVRWTSEQAPCGRIRFPRGTLGLDALEHALEFTDEQHILIDTNQGFRTVGLHFIFDIIAVLIERNFLEGIVPAWRSSAGSTICDLGITNGC